MRSIVVSVLLLTFIALVLSDNDLDYSKTLKKVYDFEEGHMIANRTGIKSNDCYICSSPCSMIYCCSGPYPQCCLIGGKCYCCSPGRTLISSSSDGQTRSAKKIVLHSDYGGSSLVIVNDIALVELDKPFTLDKSIRPIKLNDGNRGPIRPDTWSVITGWGYLTPVSAEPSEQLQQLDVRTTSLDKCKHIYPNLKLSDNNLCTTSSGRTGSCRGDSGGPLVLSGQQIGVLSTGPRPCGNGNPDIYMNVAVYRKWIKNISGV
ncbi:chymotrypsin-2-like [Oppia nitens]|uniref:chymotrypsin-2-like n=1 Tax=Oppia nitens TaxID=1686743 RepID=UPI0023DC69D3|nr:chymotrypsin-2-like [Oppia nitens]